MRPKRRNVKPGLGRYLARRAIGAAVLVLLVTSIALWLISLAPGDYFTGFDVDPAIAAAERHRLGLDRPFLVQYARWLSRVVRMDLGNSLKYGRPVSALIAERALNTVMLGATALVMATLIGIPAGILTGTRTGPVAAATRAASLVVVSMPPLVTSFVLLLFAARTGWFPVGGFGAVAESGVRAHADMLRYLAMPCLALTIPIAASIERLQSQAMRDALEEPTVRAALARGCSERRVIWRHALRLSLPPTLALYGVLVGAVLSGSFAVEFVMSWPGLGALMYEALVFRDLHLVAGCAAAGAVFLAAGVFASDVALALADPRTRSGA